MWHNTRPRKWLRLWSDADWLAWVELQMWVNDEGARGHASASQSSSTATTSRAPRPPAHPPHPKYLAQRVPKSPSPVIVIDVPEEVPLKAKPARKRKVEEAEQITTEAAEAAPSTTSSSSTGSAEPVTASSADAFHVAWRKMFPELDFDAL